MKITKISVRQLSYVVQRPYANSSVWNRSRQVWVVEVETDAGISGWGEGCAPLPSAVLAQHVLGQDPFTAEALCRATTAAGCSYAAWSAIDIALYDVMGKATQRPVHQLLGGALRSRIPTYASGLFLYDRDQPTAELTQEAGAYAAAGFPAIKMKIGFGARIDEARVAAVRSAIGPDVLLAVDANCGYDAASAIASARALERHNIYWYEEPVPPTEIAAYQEIRQAVTMPLAGGESLEGLSAFRDLVASRAVNIVQPDISIAGGFTVCRRIDALAEAHGVRTLPHMWGSPIRLAATLHWQAVVPAAAGLIPEPCLFEYDMTENGLRSELAEEPLEAVDGSIAVPNTPGLGVELDRGALARFTISEETIAV